MKAGILYLVATPIGNLEDITLRALRVLREVDLVACEDTRRSRILLKRHGINAKLLSYYGAREKQKSRQLVAHLKRGMRIALIADAGMPGVSDPGSLAVREALIAGIKVVPIPGPSAALAALSASGLSTERFAFEGFLPRKPSERKARLLQLSGEVRTMIFYESPRRLKATLEEMRSVMGERKAVVVRELTKLHEEFIAGALGEIIERMSGREVRGEIVVLVSGSEDSVDWNRVNIPAYITKLQDEMGIDRKSALKLVAGLSGLSKSVVYKKIITNSQ